MRLVEFYQEEPGGSFTHDGEEYSLNPLLKVTDEYPVKDIPVSDLKWIIDGELTQDDIKRRDDADTDVPILVTKWEDKIAVIDGYHRLLKAVEDGLEKLPAKMVSKQVLDKYKLDK